ncbi:MAG: hypothetical protein AVDCRST_MAG95-1312, partial [uncultured Adhaeribacter sp.]
EQLIQSAPNGVMALVPGSGTRAKFFIQYILPVLAVIYPVKPYFYCT